MGGGRGAKYDGSSLYSCYCLFLSFDTSGIDDAHDVIGATLYGKAYTSMAGTDFLVQVYRYAWAEALGGGNQESNYEGAYGGSATLEGTFRNAPDGRVSGTCYSMAVAPGGISKTGDTKYAMVSKEDVDSSPPTGNGYVFL